MESFSVEMLSEMSDEDLVAVMHAQPQAFSVLLERCRSMVVRMANSLAANSADAEDYAQEGLLGLLAAANSYQQNFGDRAASFRTYAYRCVRNRMQNAYRKDHAQLRLTGSSLDDPDAALSEQLSDGADSPEQAFLNKERVSELYQALKDVLSKQEMDVLSEAACGYSYREIADRLQISEKSVDNAMQRARRKLRAVRSNADI
ncbi:MAG: sigma-70 family RNA polymerase sigma factor [Oscillospiraceae bacterium]|nr:sigma-70 family RNA polymerase sigma factor [Oscillospiraceae bacterium]